MESHSPPPQAPATAAVRQLLGRFMPALVPTRATEAESIVREPKFYERLLRDASVGLGESYMEDWWETDALDVTIDKIMRANLKQKVMGSWRMRALTVKAVMLNLQAKARAGASIEAHYDIGNDLYTRMLDERMVYTCGYWKDAKTLTEAQEAKLD